MGGKGKESRTDETCRFAFVLAISVPRSRFALWAVFSNLRFFLSVWEALSKWSSRDNRRSLNYRVQGPSFWLAEQSKRFTGRRAMHLGFRVLSLIDKWYLRSRERLRCLWKEQRCPKRYVLCRQRIRKWTWRGSSWLISLLFFFFFFFPSITEYPVLSFWLFLSGPINERGEQGRAPNARYSDCPGFFLPLLSFFLSALYFFCFCAFDFFLRCFFNLAEQHTYKAIPYVPCEKNPFRRVGWCWLANCITLGSLTGLMVFRLSCIAETGHLLIFSEMVIKKFAPNLSFHWLHSWDYDLKNRCFKLGD